MPQLHRVDVRGATIRRAGQTITPVARATRLTWRAGTAEWHHPLVVEVVRDGVSDSAPPQRIAIHDTTRRAVLALLLAALAGTVALAAATGWVRQRQRTRRQPR